MQPSQHQPGARECPAREPGHQEQGGLMCPLHSNQGTESSSGRLSGDAGPRRGQQAVSQSETRAGTVTALLYLRSPR